MGPSPVESAMKPMKKMPYHHGNISIRPHTVVRRAEFWTVRNLPNDFKVLIAVAVDLSSSNGVEDASSGRHTRLVGRNLNITLLRFEG